MTDVFEKNQEFLITPTRNAKILFYLCSLLIVLLFLERKAHVLTVDTQDLLKELLWSQEILKFIVLKEIQNCRSSSSKLQKLVKHGISSVFSKRWAKIEYRSMTELTERGSHQWIYISTLSWVLLFSCAPSIHTFSNSRSNLLRQLVGEKPHYHYWHVERSNCSTSSCCSRKCACKGQKNVSCCVLWGVFSAGCSASTRVAVYSCSRYTPLCDRASLLSVWTRTQQTAQSYCIFLFHQFRSSLIWYFLQELHNAEGSHHHEIRFNDLISCLD